MLAMSTLAFLAAGCMVPDESMVATDPREGGAAVEEAHEDGAMTWGVRPALPSLCGSPEDVASKEESTPANNSATMFSSVAGSPSSSVSGSATWPEATSQRQLCYTSCT